MNEIEKMYENAGIEKLSVCEYTCMNATNCNVNCVHYNDKTTYYPPFTAEKQLKLIKWLCQKTYRNYLLFRYNFTNYYWQFECNMTDSDRVDNFSEALASVCNNLWQSLTEEERKQIKEILK